MDGTVWWIEVISYGLIAVLGARLLWVKGRALIAAWQTYRAEPSAVQVMRMSMPHAHAHVHHDHHAS